MRDIGAVEKWKAEWQRDYDEDIRNGKPRGVSAVAELAEFTVTTRKASGPLEQITNCPHCDGVIATRYAIYQMSVEEIEAFLVVKRELDAHAAKNREVASV